MAKSDILVEPRAWDVHCRHFDDHDRRPLFEVLWELQTLVGGSAEPGERATIREEDAENWARIVYALVRMVSEDTSEDRVKVVDRLWDYIRALLLREEAEIRRRRQEFLSRLGEGCSLEELSEETGYGVIDLRMVLDEE